jgi:hypothetical protein
MVPVVVEDLRRVVVEVAAVSVVVAGDHVVVARIAVPAGRVPALVVTARVILGGRRWGRREGEEQRDSRGKSGHAVLLP